MVAGGLLIALMRRPGVILFDRRMRVDAASQDAWWHAYQSALFHRGLLRLRHPGRWLRSLARYLRARLNQVKARLGTQMSQLKAGAAPLESGPGVHRTADILSFEQRGSDFVLVRSQADGSRSEIILTAANVVHLGLLAPGFARQVLTDRVGHQPGAVAQLVRHTAMNANLRFIEILLTILDRGGPRFNFPVTERRARALAVRLVERADRMAGAPAKDLK
jgi:hypothetical protein